MRHHPLTSDRRHLRAHKDAIVCVEHLDLRSAVMQAGSPGERLAVVKLFLLIAGGSTQPVRL